MVEKEFPRFSEYEPADFSDFKLREQPGGGSNGFLHKLSGILKFIFGICFLPCVYAVSQAFLNELNSADAALRCSFWFGVISLLIVYLFIWEANIIYTKGHRILEIIFNFFKPIVKVAPYLLPIYSIVLFVLYLILVYLFRVKDIINYFIFLMGVSVVFHLIFSAKSIRSKKKDFLKGNYIFGFSFIYITNISLLSLFLSIMIEKFSFVAFANNSFHIAQSIFNGLFKQLFL